MQSVCADTNSATHHSQQQSSRDTSVQYVAVFAPQPQAEELDALTQRTTLNSIIVDPTDNEERDNMNNILVKPRTNFPRDGHCTALNGTHPIAKMTKIKWPCQALFSVP